MGKVRLSECISSLEKIELYVDKGDSYLGINDISVQEIPEFCNMPYWSISVKSIIH